ncbi:MAG: PEP/pyruvate-binding domain-containing protein [Patescibacteria group bacterium]|nr:PEP/pyruvate-binding domain-containing protein [Patescibacteria group bacterium]
MKETYIKTFKQLTKKDTAIAGGKGASLGEMTNTKIPVPPGFVVLADAFDRFLEETDLAQNITAIIEKVNYNDVNSVDKASNVIRDLIHDEKVPEDLKKEIVQEYKKLKCKFVAVRSSATAEDSSVASWAGELETYLNTTEKTLLENVKKCWSSLFTPRAIFYRKEKKMLDTKVSVAVVVQKMVESEISGICFTVHPVTEDRNQMIIEAGLGLGEAIVSGSITPDSYVLDKRNWLMIDTNISEQERKIIRGKNGGINWVKVPKTEQEKQKLTNRQIIELAKICANIEKHYKKPQDIEWALEKGKFYITQSRPITTL